MIDQSKTTHSVFGVRVIENLRAELDTLTRANEALQARLSASDVMRRGLETQLDRYEAQLSAERAKPENYAAICAARDMFEAKCVELTQDLVAMRARAEAAEKRVSRTVQEILIRYTDGTRESCEIADRDEDD